MTLNEKIVDIFRTSYYEDTDGRWFSEEKAATEIEKLVLQEKIDLVNKMIDYVYGWDRENEMEFNEDGGHVYYWEYERE